MTHADTGRAPRVVVLAVHPAVSPATRLRALQFAEDLDAVGLELRLWSFFSAAALPAWYGRHHGARLLAVLRCLLRIPRALREVASADVVLVQREALPFGPPLLERWAARRVPVVWDVDDAVWETFRSPTAGRLPRWVRATAGKYRAICAAATEVWAGSEILAQWCREHSSAVRVVPTVVHVPEVRPARADGHVVSWIGSHSTGVFIADLLPVLARIDPAPEVVVVGATVAAPSAADVTQLAWSLQVEQDVLSRSRVGLYPIDRTHPLAEGKCGLKAVLYMAHGIPPVVTPTTTNATVVRDGVDGYHAEDEVAWQEAVTRLLTDDDAWDRLSASAHSRARADFSTQVWGPRLAGWLRALADGSSR